MTTNIKKDFFALKLLNGTLGHKSSTFLHSGQALWYQLKVRAKKSYLYFCQEIVFHSISFFFPEHHHVPVRAGLRPVLPPPALADGLLLRHPRGRVCRRPSLRPIRPQARVPRFARTERRLGTGGGALAGDRGLDGGPGGVRGRRHGDEPRGQRLLHRDCGRKGGRQSQFQATIALNSVSGLRFFSNALRLALRLIFLYTLGLEVVR